MFDKSYLYKLYKSFLNLATYFECPGDSVWVQSSVLGSCNCPDTFCRRHLKTHHFQL